MNQELTKLTGTEKQIKWAEDIRRNALDDLDSIIASAERAIGARAAKGKRTQMITDGLMAINEARSVLETIDDAAWWIEHREYGVAAQMGFASHSDEIISIVGRADHRDYY